MGLKEGSVGCGDGGRTGSSMNRGGCGDCGWECNCAADDGRGFVVAGVGLSWRSRRRLDRLPRLPGRGLDGLEYPATAESGRPKSGSVMFGEMWKVLMG